MTIFRPSSNSGVTAWGPAASVSVSISALGSVVDRDWVLTGISVGAREITDVRQCFNDVSYIYALGNDQGKCSMQLSFVIFLGGRSCSEQDNMGTLNAGLSGYAGSRISQMTSPTQVTIGGFSAQGWLTGINISNTDPSKSISFGQVEFIMRLPGG